MKQNTKQPTSGTSNQLWLKVFVGFIILMCGLTIYSSVWIAMYKGNHRVWPFAGFALFCGIMCIIYWPKASDTRKPFRPTVDLDTSSRKLLRTMASQDRPE